MCRPFLFLPFSLETAAPHLTVARATSAMQGLLLRPRDLLATRTLGGTGDRALPVTFLWKSTGTLARAQPLKVGCTHFRCSRRQPHHTKPKIVVAILGMVVVAIRGAEFVLVVVERPAAHNACRRFCQATGAQSTRSYESRRSPRPARATKAQGLAGPPDDNHTTRNPRALTRVPGGKSLRNAERSPYGPTSNAPPRTTRELPFFGPS
jgi:hypothetical protein